MPNDASWRLKIIEAVFEAHGWDHKAPVRDLPPEAVDYLLYAPKDEKVVVRYKHERGENTLQRHVRGRRHQPRAAVPRDRLGVHQDRAREVHGRAGPARPAAASGSSRRSLGVTVDGQTSGTSRSCRSPTRWPGPRASRSTSRERERTIAHQILKEITAAARLPRRRRARLPDHRPGVADAVRAARPSGSASRPRSGRR